ncbi:MAG: hypothetical protein QOG13_2075 [Sphingomonadales bacterium]|nr:hypothetical protein [Sphingomonadales bacterium]
MRVRAVWLACLAALHPGLVQAAPGAQAENSFFRGDQCPVPDTTPSSSATHPGVAAPSPPHRAAAAAVAGFLAALRHGEERGARRWSVGPSAGTSPACLAGLRRLAASCTPEAPYLLDNGSIRIAWVCNGLLSYNSFFVVADGKVADVDGMDATQPIVAVPARSPDAPPRGEP